MQLAKYGFANNPRRLVNWFFTKWTVYE